MTRIFILFSYLIVAATVVGCIKTSTSSKTVSQSSSVTISSGSNTQKPYLGKYNLSTGGASLEFKDNNVLVFSGASGQTQGSYSMTSATAAVITMNGLGNGNFTNNFSSFVNPQGSWNK